MTDYSMLLKPVRVGRMIWRNRIVMPACETRLSNPDGSSSREMADYYGERAKGGAAAVIVENTFVDDKESRSSLVSSGMYNDHMIASHYYVAEAIKDGGACAILQLSHGGRQASGGATGRQSVAPSAQACKFVQRMPRALEHDEVVEIEDCFAAAALRAKMAGFNGVEIHGAHGYLIDEFLSPYTNHREDEYGGSFENRRRFLANIISKVRAKVGRDFIVGVRLSAYEGVEGGLTPEVVGDIAASLQDEIDYVNVAAGIYETMEQYIIPPNYEPHAMVVPFAKIVKSKVTKIPVIVVNSLNPDTAEQALEEGCADIIAMGRPLIADPYLPAKLMEGRREDVRPCCRGHEGCVSLFFEGCPMRCEVNPMVGREREWAFRKTSVPKHIVIVGGGVAGMEAARYAAEVGHKVTLLEKSSELGGHFIEATVPSFKEDHRNVLSWLKREVAKSGTEIRMNTEATPELVKSLNPDLVIVATGSSYFRVPVEGIEKALSPDEVILGTKDTGNTVAVIGGGLVGAETALMLGEAGKKVTIVEMLSQVAANDEPLSRISLTKRLERAGVEFKLNCKVSKVTDHSVEYIDESGALGAVECDSAVAATGLRSAEERSAPFRNLGCRTIVIGDAKCAGKIFDCFHDAWKAVRSVSK